MLENPEDAHKELDRYRVAQITVDIDKTKSRTSLPKGTLQQVGAHHQGVTRKAESAPCCGYEAVQGKRTSSSARAANPASTVRRCGRLEGVVFRGCLSGFHVKNRRVVRKRHLRFFRRILPRAGAPRGTQELFSRCPAFSFWFRPRYCHDVSYGVWFKRRPAHLVQNRSCSWKGTTRQTASSRVALLDRRRIQSRLGQRDKIQSGQMDRVGVHTRFSKSDGDRQDPSQNCRCVQAGCTKTVKLTDDTFEDASPASWERRMDHESLPKGKVDNPTFVGSHCRGRTAS